MSWLCFTLSWVCNQHTWQTSFLPCTWPFSKFERRFDELSYALSLLYFPCKMMCVSRWYWQQRSIRQPEYLFAYLIHCFSDLLDRVAGSALATGSTAVEGAVHPAWCVQRGAPCLPSLSILPCWGKYLCFARVYDDVDCAIWLLRRFLDSYSFIWQTPVLVVWQLLLFLAHSLRWRTVIFQATNYAYLDSVPCMFAFWRSPCAVVDLCA